MKRQQVVDLGLALTLVAGVELQLGGRWPPAIVAMAAAAWLAAVLLRHRLRLAPLVGPAALAAAARLDTGWTPSFVLFFAIVLAAWILGWGAAQANGWRAAADAALLTAVIWTALIVIGGRPLLNAAYLTLFGLAALQLGRLARRSAGQVAAKRLQLDAAEEGRAAYVRRVADQERVRMAAELHDVVGHSVSAMTLQAGAARLKLEAGDAEAAREALVAVETVGHAALVDLRRMLGVLRRDMTAE